MDDSFRTPMKHSTCTHGVRAAARGEEVAAVARAAVKAAVVREPGRVGKAVARGAETVAAAREVAMEVEGAAVVREATEDQSCGCANCVLTTTPRDLSKLGARYQYQARPQSMWPRVLLPWLHWSHGVLLARVCVKTAVAAHEVDKK